MLPISVIFLLNYSQNLKMYKSDIKFKFNSEYTIFPLVLLV